MTTDTASFLVDDDHETWCLLSSGEDSSSSISSAAMKGLEQRWNQDQLSFGATSFWEQLTQTAQSLGFAVQSTTTQPTAALLASTATALPAAFETTSGKKHVESLSKLIQSSSEGVVQLTLGALQEVNTSNDQAQHLQSLLGTRSLFLRVLDYYGTQRSARLGIVTELLRGYSDDDANNSSFLSTIDKQVVINGADERGLLQTLLCAACAPDTPPTRDQVLPLQELGDSFFVQKVLQVLQAQRLVERQQAMEALLALLYSKLQQVSCADFILLILALQSSGTFFTTFSNNKKLPLLAGLLCAEAINLNTAGPTHSLVQSPDELKLIKNVVMNFSDQVFARREKAKEGVIVPAPESVVMLGVGLLLQLTTGSGDMECLELANTCGAFEYLQATFDALLPERTTVQLGEYVDAPLYDWQFSDTIPTLSIEKDDEQGGDMSANVVIYTSIGLELLRSIVVALHDFLVSAPDNLTALCHLGATLYANQPMLCDEFWKQPGAVGTLAEAAFGKTPASWELLASVCSNRDSVQRVMAMIPQEHMMESLSTSAEIVLPALAKMAQLDPVAIREAMADDPGVMFRVLSFYPSNEKVLEYIFDVMSSLIRDSPSWAVTCVTFFGARSSHGLLSHCFSAGKVSTVAAAARILNALVEGMLVACFNNAYPEHIVLEYLSVTVKASLAACTSLSSIFAFSSQPSVSYFNAYLILKASADLITVNRQLRSLHGSIKVREAAMEARAQMLEMFATTTSFGQALAYFAGAPVSLSIGLLIEETLQEASLLQLATEEYAVDESTNAMGKWHGLLQKASEAPIDKVARERLGNLKKVPINMAAVRSRGWSDSESSPVHAASAAIKLLKAWAMEAEDVLLTQLVENKEEFLTNSSPYRLLNSSATMPPIVKATPKLAHLWPACGLSTSDLLVHLIANVEADGRSLPFHESLSLLSLSAAHAKFCGGLIGNTFKATSPLFTCMKDAIQEAITDESKEDMQNGILFVKLLGYILNVDFALGLSLLEHDDSAIGKALAGSTKAVLSKQVPTLDRLGAESLRVMRLAKKADDIRADLVRLATISREPSLVRSELVAQSLEILAESELAGEATDGVQGLLSNARFHEEGLVQFRDCVLSICKATAKFRPIAMQMKSCVNLSSPSFFAQAFPSGDTRAVPDIMSLNQYDMKAAATMLYFLDKEHGDAGQIAAATEGLLTCMVSVKKQVEAVAAWTRFLQVSANGDKAMSPEVVKQIVTLLVDNVHELAQLKVEVEQEVASLSTEMEAIFEVSSNLLLELISLDPSSANLDHVDLQKMLETIEVIVPKAGASRSKETCVSLNNLLAVAAVVLKTSQTNTDLTRFVHIIRQAMFMRDDAEIFRTALALLAAVLHTETIASDRRTRAKLANAMLEGGLVNALVDALSAASARAVKDKDTFDEDEVTTVQSIITVLLDISNAGEGEATFGALFLQSNLTKMLLSNPLFAQAIPRWVASGTDSHYRGYIKSSSKRANEGGMERVAVFLSGRSDPVHKVWRLAIRLVTSLLRVSANHGRHRDFQKLALDFVRVYDGVLRSCLAKCSQVGQNSVLTHSLVDEADETLALLSELNTKSDGFLDIAVSVVGSLGKFLGAIGSSRFLFKLARDVEAANQEQDNAFGNPQELHPALSGGVSNARFEAIRYAHYARSAYAMVTSDDHKEFSAERGSVPSGNDLEKTCYRAINNSFCGEIEVAVAYCLTNALTLLSKAHPASSSFMLFSQEESQRLNHFTIVRIGAIIAFHSDDSLKFARVISSDTVRRSWKCTMIDQERREIAGEEVTVSVADLAGVEDIKKRKVLFQYLPAPDAATELEHAEHKATNLGHLVLTLRWCRQGETGIDAEVRTDLAESTSALLATELALHREIGTEGLAKDAVTTAVNDQLYDLLDPQSKFQGLTECISPDFLQRIRRQLEGMLELARKDRAEKRATYEARLAAMNASNPFWR